MAKERKIILITGATAGIGEAIALLFAQNNWDIIITGRRQERLNKLQQRLEKEHGVAVLSLCFDVRDREATELQLQEIPAHWKQIDVLANNAGLAMGRDKFQDSLVDDWEVMLDTNVKGLLYVSKVVSNFMIENGYGHIINISSIAGKQVYAMGHVYCATKHAVDALSKGMRIDLLAHGIRVTSINPGAVETEFSIVRYKGDLEKANKVYEGFIPLYAADIADNVYYAATRPPHVNINEIIVTCLTQADAFNKIKSS